MSLLMDALKKAEEAKRQAAQSSPPETAAPGDLELAPLDADQARQPARDAAPAALPELPSRLEILDQQFERPAPPKPRRTPEEPAASAPSPSPSGETADMAAARRMFEAKMPPSPDRKPLLVLVAIVALGGAAGIGGWLWWQTRPAGGAMPGPGASAPVSRPVSAPPTQTAAAQPAPPSADAAEPASVGAASPKTGAATADPATPIAASGPRPTEAAVRSPAVGTAAPADSPIRISRSRPQVNPAVSRAYEAMSAGRLDQARTDYEQVLKTEPRNVDALLGLAAIALREGRPGDAEELYQRAAETDPKEAAAIGALIGLRGQADPLQAESRLKTLIAGQPEQASLHFALGNLQARQNQWSEAQQSYFKAHTLDPENPDIVFNLAVSLDHLRQTKLAVQYYNRSLSMAETRPAAFDRSGVAARLRELQDR